MPKNTNSLMQEAKNRPLAFLVQLATVVFLILNLYLATKLSPLEQNIVTNAKSIEEIKSDTEELLNDQSKFVSDKDLDTITNRLDRIEDKLDRVIEGR